MQGSKTLTNEDISTQLFNFYRETRRVRGYSEDVVTARQRYIWKEALLIRMAGLLQLFSPNTPTQNPLVTGSQLRHFGMSCRLDFFQSIFINTTVTLSPTVYIKTPILFTFFWSNYIWNLNWWNLKHAIPIVLLYLVQIKIGGNRIHFST